MEQERDRDDDVTTKNQKLRRKIDKCKSELADARRDVSTLQSQLEQVRQDKVVQLSSVGLQLFILEKN